VESCTFSNHVFGNRNENNYGEQPEDEDNMPRIFVTEHNGAEHVLNAGIGESVMRAVVDSGVRGLLGDCGGNLACATCHVYVSQLWWDKLVPPIDVEEVLLETAVDVCPNSRLTCQILMSDELDGLEITLPASQF
jgi:2Fe-2S ferredoxin